MPRPRVLFYCQHSLGLGHLARTLAIVEETAIGADVVLLNGGRFPAGRRAPGGVEIVHLPPLGHDEGYDLVSLDPRWDLESARTERRRLVLDVLERFEPDVIVIELYPFGRKKFEFELRPLLEANHALGDGRARVVCSLRDILVNQRRDQQRHDDRAATVANEFVDRILVHADPAFADLAESFRPSIPLHVPVEHTGFVAPPPLPPARRPRLDRVIVSAGGGSVGGPLLRAAAAASRAVYEATGLGMLLVAGPFLPDDDWAALRTIAADHRRVELVRQVPDLRSEIAASQVSVSQCGYNTTMDLLRAGTPSVVVPYSEGKEDEQRRRADRLARLGVVQAIEASALTPQRLTAAVVAAVASTPTTLPLDLDGRAATARILWDLAADRGRDRVPVAVATHTSEDVR